MALSNFLRDNADLQYYLNGGVDWPALVSLAELGFGRPGGFEDADDAVAFYRESAAAVGEFVARDIAPHAAEIDRQGVRFESGEAILPSRFDGIFRKMGELGLYGMNLPRELGGTNLPVLLYFVANELLARGDVSVMAHYGFHAGTAMAMLMFSLLEGSTELDGAGRVVATRWRREIEEIADGRAWGSMDITESDAGSDMAALRCSAAQDAAGQWAVTGQKIFITSGHGKYHFVIARTEPLASEEDARSGLAGLSLFMVPAYREDGGRRVRLASLDRVEEKLGHHGSATVAITFDRTPADLVGQRGKGFRQMLEFMNHARLSVGFESIGLCEAALRMARDYAAGRRSMGKTIDRHEIIADYLDEMETDIIGLRALAMHAAFEDELGGKKALFGRFLSHGGAAAQSLESEAAAHHANARRFTPLLKYLAAEKAVEMSRRCLQIHGGNGYMKEYGAEKLLRDAMVMPIYEGTSQIQALMAMKDTLGAMLRAPQQMVKRVAQTKWRALSAKEMLERRVARVSELSLAAQQHLLTRTLAGKVKTVRREPIAHWAKAFTQEWNPKRDFSLAMLHAERLTRLLADEAILEVLLAQSRRHDERRPALERYLDRAEPRARFLHDEITTTGARVVKRLSED